MKIACLIIVGAILLVSLQLVCNDRTFVGTPEPPPQKQRMTDQEKTAICQRIVGKDILTT